MADQGKWFKLWCAALRDDDLENLSIHEWFGWARLGTHIKENGKDGKLRIRRPAINLLNLLRVTDFNAAINMIKRFPNYVVEEMKNVTANVTNESVTYKVQCLNWSKYQGDFSGDRVRKHRHRVTANVTRQEERRREEKRREEKREIHQGAEIPYKEFLTAWNTHAQNMPKAFDLTDKRRRKIRQRWLERPSLDYWARVIQRMAKSGFMTGKSERGWIADFDWLIANDTNHVKVVEGKYDDRRGNRASNDSESILIQAARYKAARKNEEIRKVPSAGEILAGLRDLPDVPATPKAGSGDGD